MPAILTIHGTFASSDVIDYVEATGQWWQRGSPFLQALAAHLDDATVLEPFVWTGDNLESARRSAGVALAKRLRTLERPVHLVAHSHGGTALWHALGALEEAQLARIASVTTVGTPFLVYRWDPYGLVWALPLPAALAGLLLGARPATVAEGLGPWMAHVGSLTTTLRTDTQALLALAALVWVGATLAVAVGRVGQVLSARGAVSRDHRETTRAASRLGQRWLGIRSGFDEARFGLERSRLLTLKVTSLPWLLDDQVMFAVRRRLQGADLPHQLLDRVAASPDAPAGAARLNLPDGVDDGLLRRAMARLAEEVGLARRLMGSTDDDTPLEQTLEGIRDHLSFRGLVHNGYFDDPYVIGAIADHIRRWDGHD